MHYINTNKEKYIYNKLNNKKYRDIEITTVTVIIIILIIIAMSDNYNKKCIIII